MNSEPGFCIPCYTGDTDLLYGCLNSIKDYYPDSPICLIPDGRSPVGALIKRYGLHVIDRAVVHPALRKWSYGYGLTKMIAFWHSPFEYFWHVDADTILWGDGLRQAPFREGAFICNSPHEEVTDFILHSQYFRPHSLPDDYKELVPSRDELFNSGVFLSARGSIALGDYLALAAHQKAHPGSIFTDQGILNLLVSKAEREGKLVVERRELQTIVAITPIEILRSRYSFEAGRPSIDRAAPAVIHWAGKKPRISEGGPFCEPMTFFRLRSIGLEKYRGSRWARWLLGTQEICYWVLLRLQRSRRVSRLVDGCCRFLPRSAVSLWNRR